MTISFETGSSGWAKYVIEGTTQEPRNKELIEVIENDPFFVEKIARYNKFSGEYYKVMISAEKKLSTDEMKTIYEEFKKELFVGLKEDEYICSAVLHQDTDHSHIHICVPKQNLLTGQHLQLYMYGIDTKRMDLIADNIALKHGLITKEESKQTIKKTKEYSFEKQRAERNQEPFTFTFTSKKSEAMAKQQVTELLKENIESINSLNEVKAFIHSNTNLKVTKADYDRTKKFHYITIQDTNDKKVRVQGDLFNPDFFKQPKSEQMQQLQVNHKTFSEAEREAYAKQVRANLKREREKRFKKVQHQGRALKLKIRQEQRILNNTIRKEPKLIIKKEKYENPRRTTTPSPTRSQRSPSTKTTNNSYARARESRKREREARAREREKRTKSYAQYHNGATETDIGSLVREYRKCQLQREKERLSRGIIRELFNKISTVTRHFFEKIRKIEVEKDTTTPTVKEKATPIVEKAQNKENIKPTEAPESPNAVEENDSTVESPMSKEGLEKEFEELVKSSKKLTEKNQGLHL